jgi:hypothetical protein
MKKVLVLFLLTLLPLAANAYRGYDAEIDNIYYKLNKSDKTASVSYKENYGKEFFSNYSGDVTIPSEVTYENITYKVTSVGDYAFYDCGGLTSVTIPNSVTSIGKYAFYHCDRMNSIDIPGSVISIGESAFACCFGIGVVNISYGVTSIGRDAFNNCYNLISATIPNSVTSIGESAFMSCSKLNSIDIPGSVSTIGGNAFQGCCSLESLTIGEGVSSIGESAFQGCTSLESLTIGEGVTSIGESAFDGCSELKLMTIPSSVSTIGDNAFKGISFLKVTWQTQTPPSGYEKVRSDIHFVRSDQFSFNYPTEVVVYPLLSYMFEVDGVKYVPVSTSERTCDAFECNNNESVVNINVPSKIKYNKAEFSVKIIQPCFAYNNKHIENLTIDINGEISDYAFCGCSILKTVTLGNNITTIREGAFKDCEGLTAVYTSDLVTWCNIKFHSNPLSYAHHLFLNNEEIKKLVIPNGVSSLYGTFMGCSGLTSVTIPNSVTEIDYAFAECSGLTSVTIPNSVTSLGNLAFFGCSGLTSVTIPEGVQKIGSSAFSGCSGLTSVTIPNSVTEICDNAFHGCSGLTSVTIPDGVKTIGFYAFGWCSGLASVIIPDGVQKIDGYAFVGCSGLISVTIPNSVTSIGESAFSRCSSLKKVLFYGRPYRYNVNNEVYSASKFFASCPLEDVCLGANLSLLSFYDNKTLRIVETYSDLSAEQFYGCTNLRKAILEVNKIGNRALKGCSKLNDIRLGINMQNIGEEAFSECTNVKRLVCQAKTPPTCGSLALNDIDKWNCTLYVPEGTKAAYQKADQWNEFFFIEEGEPVIIPGNANGDEELNEEDVKAIGDYILGVLSDDFDEDAADFNGDGKVDILDIVAIIKYLKENK